MKPIPTRIHEIVDYLTAITLMVLPFLLGFTTDFAGSMMMAMGVFVFGYSLFTGYELGVARIVPMKLHLLLDFLSGVAFILAPFFFFYDQTPIKTIVFVVVGVFELAMSLLTQTEPLAVPTKTTA